jgi:hypothetical protein
MVQAKRQLEIVRALRKHGARKVREGANHEVWRCGCEAGHQTELPRHTQVTTFVTNRIDKQMLKCPDFGEDWLR